MVFQKLTEEALNSLLGVLQNLSNVTEPLCPPVYVMGPGPHHSSQASAGALTEPCLPLPTPPPPPPPLLHRHSTSKALLKSATERKELT